MNPIDFNALAHEMIMNSTDDTARDFARTARNLNNTFAAYNHVPNNTTILRSGHTPMTRDELDDYCCAAARATDDPRELDFYDQVRHINRIKHFHEPPNGGPLHDAAHAVTDFAFDARAMLNQIKSGWLWQLITIQPKQS